jgi:hypothetical protein
MTFDVALFRKQFPEFADTVQYPTPMVDFWSGIASQQVNQNKWCEMWVTGVSLYTAHELVIAQQSAKAAKQGGVAGTSGGIANTKTVGSVTVGYDATSTTEKDAGYWNRTTYGIQFIRLTRIFGAGVIQL